MERSSLKYIAQNTALPKIVNTYNPVKVAFHEWINMGRDFTKAKSIKDCWNYLFNAPGWSNDGTSKTTRQLRKENKVINKVQNVLESDI